jgi:hypothetical protein
VDSELNLDDLAAYEQTLAPVLTGPAQDSSAEPAWELRTNAAPMTMAETLRGRVLYVILASARNHAADLPLVLLVICKTQTSGGESDRAGRVGFE